MLMGTSRRRLQVRCSKVDLTLVVLSLAGTVVGCSSGGPATGTGGTSGGSGGTSSQTGGTSGGTGGAPGPGTGGTLGSGGASPGSGGAMTGGTTGSGGSASGGATGSGGGGGTVASGGRGGMPGTAGHGNGGAAGAPAGSGGAAGGTSGTGCLDFKAPVQVGTIAATGANGPSGIVASRAHPGVLYAQMDTGGPSTIFAMTTAGKALGEYTLTGVSQNDWEDIAVGKGPGAGSYIYLGDIGDNSANRTQIQVYRVPEPEVSPTQAAVQQAVTSEVLKFTYPDKAHNAETLLLDPVTGDIIIVTKETSGMSVVYRAPGNTPVDTPTVLEKVTTVQIGTSGQAAQASGGDISPTGDRFMVRSYETVLIWPRAATLTATFMAAPHMQAFATEPQGEGITFSADGKAWIAAGEQARIIYQADATCP